MIRKEIKEDGSFGGNYPYDIDYLNLPQNFIEITEEQRDFIDNNIGKLRYDGTQDGIFEQPKGVIDISTTTEYIAKEVGKNKELKKNEILSQIQEIETKKIRALTDFILSGDNTYLLKYEGQISELREQLVDL